MAAIQNDRDIILQATSPRVIPVKIPIDQVEGLPQALKRLRVNSSATTFIGSTTTNPSTITLTAQKLGGLEGSVTWTVISGTATLTSSGDVATVQGSSVVGSSVSVQARVTVDGVNYEAQTTLSKFGSLASEEKVDLTTQVTGQLASGNVTGLGALALLNKVDLNTQTVGALNGQTQITNLGSLAYANAIAANQIGAGTLAAGVIYAGTINADKINGGSFSGKEFTGGTFTGSTFTGSIFQTATSGNRVIIDGSSGSSERNTLRIANNTQTTVYMSTDVPVRVMKGSATVYLGYGLGALTIFTSSNHVHMNPGSSFPGIHNAGSVFMHSTHGLCMSNGVQWLKTTWTPV